MKKKGTKQRESSNKNKISEKDKYYAIWMDDYKKFGQFAIIDKSGVSYNC